MKTDNLAIKTFDYEGIDPEAKSKLIWYAGQIAAAASDHVKRAVEMGQLIYEAHELLAGVGRDGHFKPWVEKECGFSRRTAYRYMAAWSRFGKCDSLSRFSAEAVYELSPNTVPTEASDEAMKLAKKGRRISIEVAKEILNRHREVRAQAEQKAIREICQPVDEPPATLPMGSPAEPGVNDPAFCPPDDPATDFDPTAIEQAPPAEPVKPKKPGAPTVGRKLRDKTKRTLGELIRLLADCGVYDEFVAPLSQIAERIERL